MMLHWTRPRAAPVRGALDAGTATRARESRRSRLHCLWYVWLENKAWAGLSRPDADPKEHEADKIAILDSIQRVRQATWFEWKDGSRPFLLGVGKKSVLKKRGSDHLSAAKWRGHTCWQLSYKFGRIMGCPDLVGMGLQLGPRMPRWTRRSLTTSTRGRKGETETQHTSKKECASTMPPRDKWQ
jgi:hypothetical protein